MFMGSIPDSMRRIVHEHAAAWPRGSDVYVGCSGNMTIERTIAPLGVELHSNDVSSYSCALGWYFSGQPVPFQLSESSRDELGWMEPSLDDGAGTVAALMLCTRFLASVGRDNLFHRRQVQAHRDQWQVIHGKTAMKLELSKLRLASYAAQDVVPWLGEIPDGRPVLMFPPFYGGDYAQMFKAIDTHFDWPAPPYQELDDAGRDKLTELITSRETWLIGLHTQHPELTAQLRGIVQTTNRGLPIYLYGSGGHTRLVAPHQDTEDVGLRQLGPGEDLGNTMRLHVLSAGQFSLLRSHFMSKSILPGTPLIACGVSVDRKLIGAFAYLPPKFDPAQAYLMSDFPVPWSQYKRLAKLIVMAALSAEAKHLLQRSLGHRLTSAGTTAFTDRPNSSKYGRGIPGMYLAKRTEPGGDGIHAYQLQYEAPLGELTCKEALRLWTQKHANAK